MLLDAGADIRADADDLLKYAVMGASYARNALGLTRPRVGLLNVGTEEHKGRSELHEAAERMAEVGPISDFEYIGYVEGTDMPSDRVDVIVTDGFTGNVALKTGEGTARMIQGLLEGGLRLLDPLADRRALRAHLAQAAAEAHRPAPGQRRGLPRPQRHGDQVARLGRRHRRLGGDQARLHPRRPRLHPAPRRPGRRRPAGARARPRPRRLAHMTVLRAVALGCGHYLPARVVENDEFAAMVETSDEWIRTRTGIERRHFAADGEMTSDLATAAARAALADAGLTGADIDTLIVATATPDQTFPATAVTVQNAIGMRGGFAFDVQAVCAGFVFALAQANALIQAGTSRRVMVIGAETFSRILDFTDRIDLRALRRRRRRADPRGGRVGRAAPATAASSPPTCTPTAATATCSTSTAAPPRPAPPAW